MEIVKLPLKNRVQEAIDRHRRKELSKQFRRIASKAIINHRKKRANGVRGRKAS